MLQIELTLKPSQRAGLIQNRSLVSNFYYINKVSYNLVIIKNILQLLKKKYFNGRDSEIMLY